MREMIPLLCLIWIPMCIYGMAALYAKACTAEAKEAKRKARIRRQQELKQLKW